MTFQVFIFELFNLKRAIIKFWWLFGDEFKWHCHSVGQIQQSCLPPARCRSYLIRGLQRCEVRQRQRKDETERNWNTVIEDLNPQLPWSSWTQWSTFGFSHKRWKIDRKFPFQYLFHLSFLSLLSAGENGFLFVLFLLRGRETFYLVLKKPNHWSTGSHEGERQTTAIPLRVTFSLNARTLASLCYNWLFGFTLGIFSCPDMESKDFTPH